MPLHYLVKCERQKTGGNLKYVGYCDCRALKLWWVTQDKQDKCDGLLHYKFIAFNLPVKVFAKSVDICRSHRQDVLFCTLYTVRRPLIYSGRKECSSGHTVRRRSCSLPVSLHKLPRTHFITNAKRFDIWTAPTALSLSPHIQCVLWYKASARLQSLLADYRYGKSMLARVCILYTKARQRPPCRSRRGDMQGHAPELLILRTV